MMKLIQKEVWKIEIMYEPVSYAGDCPIQHTRAVLVVSELGTTVHQMTGMGNEADHLI